MGRSQKTAGAAGVQAVKAAPVAEMPEEPQAGEKASRRGCLQKQLRKTKFCMYHLKGACQYGADCAFAHTCTELQAVPDLRNTRICKAYQEGGCNDPKCTFAHGEDDLRSTDMFFKKTLCIWHEKKRCRNGDQCRFAHGIAELRRNQTAMAEMKKAMMTGVDPHTAGARAMAFVTNTNGKVKLPISSSGSSSSGSESSSKKIMEEPMKVEPAGLLGAQRGTPESASPEGLGATPWQLQGLPQGAPPGATRETLQNDLEKLCSNITALSMQCNQFQTQMTALQAQAHMKTMGQNQLNFPPGLGTMGQMKPEQNPFNLPLEFGNPYGYEGMLGMQGMPGPYPEYYAESVSRINANVAAMLMGPKDIRNGFDMGYDVGEAYGA